MNFGDENSGAKKYVTDYEIDVLMDRFVDNSEANAWYENKFPKFKNESEKQYIKRREEYYYYNTDEIEEKFFRTSKQIYEDGL